MKTVMWLLMLNLSFFIFPVVVGNGYKRFVIADEKSMDMEGKIRSGDIFVSSEWGLNLLQGEQDGKQNIFQRLKCAKGLSVGEWFDPYFGLCFQFENGSLRGFNYKEALEDGYYLDKKRMHRKCPLGDNYEQVKGKDNQLWQNFFYKAVTIDVMTNMTNRARGYYEKPHKIDVVPYMGVGLLFASKSETNPSYVGLTGKIGGRINWNLKSQLSIYGDTHFYVADADFDGYRGSRGMDIVFNNSFGVQYFLYSPPSKKKAIYFDGEGFLNDIFNEYNDGINEIFRSDKRDSEYHVLCDFIFFSLNSFEISASELEKIKELAFYLENYPYVRLQLIGYADISGNNFSNYILSRRRAESVASALKDAGISSERLIIEWRGDSEQPFADISKNRVVFLIKK